jgi:hypothetical protein
VQAVERFEKQQAHFQNRPAIRQAAFRFQPSVFRRKVATYVAAAARRRSIDLQPEGEVANRELEKTNSQMQLRLV